MPRDRDDDQQIEHKLSWTDQIDADARAAFDEVSKRVSDAARNDDQSDDRDTSADRRSTGNRDDDQTNDGDRGDGRDKGGRFVRKTDTDDKEPKQTDLSRADSRRDQRRSETRRETNADDARRTDGDQRNQGKQPDGKTADGQTRDDQTRVTPNAATPPPSFSVKSKADWDRLPDHVKADIAKREAEMSQGLAALRDYKDLKPWAEMAAKHNTTIAQSLDRYVRMDQMLTQNIAAGLAHITQQKGLNQQQAAELFATMAAKLGHKGTASPNPNPGADTQPGAQGTQEDPLIALLTQAIGPILDQRLNPIAERVTALDGVRQQQVDANRTAQTQTLDADMDAFFADPANRYVENVAEAMTKLFESGRVKWSGNNKADLKTAYDIACREDPEVSEALIEQRVRDRLEAQRKADGDEARASRDASRSLTGSRMPGSTTQVRDQQFSDDDVTNDVMAALRQLQTA